MNDQNKDTPKDWEKPELEEILLNCEITSYSSGELPEDII
jgi:hypothetical protein